jgi:hypothetical protein
MNQMDSTDDDGAQDANLDASSKQDKPSSFDPISFAKDLEARILAKMNDPRNIQSQKDQVIAAIKKDKGMKEVLAEIERMETEGLTRAEIKQELRLRELEARQTPEPASPAQSVGKQVAPAVNNSAMTLLAPLGLDANDPEVTRALLGDDFAEVALQLATISQRKRTSPNPASVAQPAGGGFIQPNEAQMEAQYKKEIMGMRGNKAGVQAIKQKYQELGLDITNVVLSI